MKTPTIVQLVRRIGPGGGVSGVAFHLESELMKLGVATERITAEDVPLLRSRVLARLPSKPAQLIEVVAYSLAAPFLLRRRKSQGSVVSITHNDCLTGDIYVNHGVHKLTIKNAGSPIRMMLRNPIHLFIQVREATRYLFQANKVVVNFTNSGQRELESAHNLRSMQRCVIPNGVDLERYFPDIDARHRTRATLGIKDDTFVLLFVGHEFERKGLDVILQAVAHLPGQVELIVVGGHVDLLAKAQEKASSYGVNDRVHFAGPQTDLNCYYNAADALVLMSTQEALPLVILEAMASGLPTVATPVSSIPDVVEHEVTGLLVERQPKELVGAVDRLIDCPELTSAMRDACLVNAEKYRWSDIAERYLRLAGQLQEIQS